MCWCVILHLCIKPLTASHFHSVNQVGDEPFACSIEAIYKFSAVAWCNDTPVNNYIKVLKNIDNKYNDVSHM